MADSLTKGDIEKLLRRLADKLEARGVIGELNVVGGAVMCVVLNARPSTKDLDAAFAPTSEMRAAVAEIAGEMDLPASWLNDAVKGYLSPNGKFDLFLELSHLKVWTATPEYMLAMKALSMRIGEEFQDENDVRYLLRYLNVETYARAIEIITQYFDSSLIPLKTHYALEEMFEKPAAPS